MNPGGWKPPLRQAGCLTLPTFAPEKARQRGVKGAEVSGSRGMAKLIFIGDKFGGRVYDLAVEKITVGRGDHNTLTIADASISHTHCEILVYGMEVIVRDLGSRNGTFVNGVRLQDQQKPLHDGQIVKFGSVEARLQLLPPPDSSTVTDVTAVHAHARHAAEPNAAPPAPSSPFRPTASGPAPTGEHTILLPKANAPESAPATPEQPTSPSRSPRGIWLVIVIVAVVALLIAVLGALLGGR
jgi:pSer/pThr/pTyr-binding forkhead associated (FHA) protein